MKTITRCPYCRSERPSSTACVCGAAALRGERDAARAECRRLEAQAARIREALQDTQSLVGNIHRYIEYVSPPLHQLITALQERVRKALAETDAGALPAREESGGNDAQAARMREALEHISGKRLDGSYPPSVPYALDDAQAIARRGLAETDAGAIPAREESAAESAKPGGILPHGRDAGLSIAFTPNAEPSRDGKKILECMRQAVEEAVAAQKDGGETPGGTDGK